MSTISYGPDAAPAGAPAAGPVLVLAIEGARPTSGSSRHLVAGVTEVVVCRGDARSVLRTGEPGQERLRLSVPDPHMSGTHARLASNGDGWFAEDLNSKNGLFVGGKRHARVQLADGDVLRLGQSLFLYRSNLAIPAGAARDVDASAQHSSLTTLVPSLAQRFDGLLRVAGGDIAVLVRGETGTGKELVAKAVHALSGRKGAFVAVNCGALPASLVESELFGHKRGAFSGATADRPGLFAAADGGTLLLDEVGDLALSGQTALLRALQEREVRPLGATEAVKVDVRIVAATHRDLEAQVARGEFREDLYARLSSFISICLRSARDREDIGLLTAAILRRIASAAVTLTPTAGEALFAHSWPRNVRELEAAFRARCSLPTRR